MKKFPLLFLVGSLLVPAWLSAAAFEGKITSKITTPDAKPSDQPPLMTMSLKEGFYRVDMEMSTKEGKGALGGMIMDLKKEEMIILMPQQKMYMVRAIPKPEQGEQKTDKTELQNSGDFTVERTGQTEKILGYTCEKILIKSKDTTSEIWATDQLGTYMGSSAGPAPGGGGGMFGRGGKRDAAAAQSWEKALSGKDFFPLRVVSLDKKGKEIMRMETVAIDKKSLSASDFAPPADFQKFDMGNMMKGMIPGLGK